MPHSPGAFRSRGRVRTRAVVALHRARSTCIWCQTNFGKSLPLTFDTSKGIHPVHEPVLSGHARRSLTKLTSLKLHRKLGHLGDHPKCPVCHRQRKKRRLTMTKSPRIDMIGDRTMVVDSIYWSNKDCDGNQYTTCGRCQRSGYVVTVHMQTTILPRST